MGVNWTAEQQQVIDLRNRNILVSAAAGSGKTAVLVERIIARLTRDEEPLNIDEILSVTFTNAAAAEMRERILDAIELALESDADNEHLQKQATLIHSAKITTIHSFCLDVIREYFHVIDLDPTFRTAEDGELSLLKKDVLGNLLEEAYKEARVEFLRFVEVVAPGKKDTAVEELILELYETSRSNPRPEQWLEDCRKNYEIHHVEELEQSLYAKKVLEECKGLLEDCRGMMKKAMAICDSPYGPMAYKAALESDLMLFDQIEEKETLRELELIFGGSSIWVGLKGVTKKDKESGAVDEELVEQVKAQRALGKKPLDDFKKAYFHCSLETQVKLFAQSAPIVNELVGLVLLFAKKYKEEKRAKNILEFNDMEHYALEILTEEVDGVLAPSIAAREYQKKFKEVMIDEYQDSNLIQETIVTSMSRMEQGEFNVFMVGDVKQSIYRFRASRPELFMEKFNTYGLEDGVKQRIDLHKNFRSRIEVLDGTNYVFDKIMRQILGGVAYDEKAALYLGADYAFQTGNEMEVRILDVAQLQDEKALEIEAKDVARRIQELVGSQLVLDKKTKEYRPATYGDIVILTRSTPSWTTIMEILGRVGVPAHVESKEGYFTSWEIALLLDYLSVIDNPKQDLPLAAVLTSTFAHVTDGELAHIRAMYPREAFHEGVFAYAYNQDETCKNQALREKLCRCLDEVKAYQKRVTYMSIYEVLNHILEETGYQEFVYGRPEGEQRRANLNKLLETAMTFEKTSYKGLFNFIRYIEQLQKYKIEMGEASISDSQDNVVRLMTIHKSKGLEFPIVILMGMGKQFNLRDANSMMIKHQDLGIGMDAIDLNRRVKSRTMVKHVIRNQIRLDSKGEELRVLYVAMTRAKEKLILTGAVSDLERMLDKIQEKDQRSDYLSYLQLTQAGSYYDWILPSICYHPSFDEAWISRGKQIDLTHPFRHHQAYVPSIEVKEIQAAELLEEDVVEVMEDVLRRESLERVREKGAYSQSYSQVLEEQLSYAYPFAKEKDFQLKVTVSEIKKQDQLARILGKEMQEESMKYQKNPSNSGKEKIVPQFMKTKGDTEDVIALTGAQRGDAYHRLMEVWDYTRSYKVEEIQPQIEQLVTVGKLTQGMASCIAVEDVRKFLEAQIGQRMRLAASLGCLYKEQPFVMKVPASQIYHVETEEYTIVQGIIDVYFEEEDGLVLLDYKTDNVRNLEELRQRYQGQLDDYVQALEKLRGIPVKEKIIYSFKFHEMIRV